VGPRRTDIHVLTALSLHPCGSAHCASSAFGLHPGRVLRRLEFLCSKIKIKSKSFPAKAVPTDRMHIHCRSALARDGVLSATQMPLTHRYSRAGALLQLIFIKPADLVSTQQSLNSKN
jgi:hypothetical protein